MKEYFCIIQINLEICSSVSEHCCSSEANSKPQATEREPSLYVLMNTRDSQKPLLESPSFHGQLLQSLLPLPPASTPALSLIGPYEVWQLGFAPRKKENSLFKEWTGSFGNSADKGFSQSLKFGSRVSEHGSLGIYHDTY